MAFLLKDPFPKLQNSPIKIEALRIAARNELVNILQEVRGEKTLVLDPQISGLFTLISGISFLKEKGVAKVFTLTKELETPSKAVIYIVRPKQELMKDIASHIISNSEKGIKKDYAIYFMPRKTMLCDRVLEDMGVYGDVSIGEYPIDLIPFDDDVLSLQYNTCFKECYLDGDRTSLFYVAKSIMKLQMMFGIIPNILGKGSMSKHVADMILKMRNELTKEEINPVSEIDTIILFDRNIDMVTPVCTQLTYEGLIDEFLEINNSFSLIDRSFLGLENNPNLQTDKVLTPLNSNDPVYSELRDLNFNALAVYLKNKARNIQDFEKNFETKKNSITHEELKDSVKILPERACLPIHISIAAKLKDISNEIDFDQLLECEQSLLAGVDDCDTYIEECINKKDPIQKVLRLLILRSLTMGGIASRKFEFFRNEIIQQYGFKYLFTLDNLYKLKLFTPESTYNFKGLRKRLNLITEGMDVLKPNDFAFVFGGYAPVSIRLIHEAIKNDGFPVENSENPFNNLFNSQKDTPSIKFEQVNIKKTNTQRKIFLIFFIGGITFSEISALRWLSQQYENVEFVIATTQMINGNSIVDSLMTPVGKSPFVKLDKGSDEIDNPPSNSGNTPGNNNPNLKKSNQNINQSGKGSGFFSK